MVKIAVASGKGGTGKTFVSTNIFYTLLTSNYRAMLVDCDAEAPNAIAFFKTELKGSSEVTQMVPENKSRMYSGSFRKGKMVFGRLAPGEENSGKLVNMVRDKAKKLAKENDLETILLDGPPGIGCPVISTITRTDRVVIVTEPTISGLSDMKRTVKIVQKFNLRSYVIINKCDLNSSMTQVIKKWCKKNGIDIAGQLPFRKEMVEAMIQGKSITEYNSELGISKEISKIWKKILKQ